MAYNPPAHDAGATNTSLHGNQLRKGKGYNVALIQVALIQLAVLADPPDQRTASSLYPCRLCGYFAGRVGGGGPWRQGLAGASGRKQFLFFMPHLVRLTFA